MSSPTSTGCKTEARRAGHDVIDFGFGNPDLPSPDIAVDKLAEAVRNRRNHRYSAHKGIPNLRLAIANHYQRRLGIALDPETEVLNVIGAKEGFTHLMWTLLQPGDACLVPAPSYPIHIWGPIFAGAAIREVPLAPGDEFVDNLRAQLAVRLAQAPGAGHLLPPQPHHGVRRPAFFQKVVDFCLEHEMVVVHDNAYADIGFDGYEPPSILQAEGARECAVELYSMTKSFSMAGWRVAFLVGNAADGGGAGQAQELPRLRHVPAGADRRHRHPQRGVRPSQAGAGHLPVPP